MGCVRPPKDQDIVRGAEDLAQNSQQHLHEEVDVTQKDRSIQSRWRKTEALGPWRLREDALGKGYREVGQGKEGMFSMGFSHGHWWSWGVPMQWLHGGRSWAAMG